jgi:3-oxoadipate enol-lactonase
MAEDSVIHDGDWHAFERVSIEGRAGVLSVRVGGPALAPAILFNHSILTSSGIWHRQATRLVGAGFRAICVDTRGHGQSLPSPGPYTMSDLAADNVAVLDALSIPRVHQVGVSQGGMTGLRMGVRYPNRLASLFVCAARADAPALFAASWEERIVLARRAGVGALAAPTAERWFGAAFLKTHRDIADALTDCIARTSIDGFIGCAQAMQGLDELDHVGEIDIPTSLVVGGRDEALLQPMREIAVLMPTAEFTVIEDAGHLPQVEQPEHFDQVLLRHLERAADPVWGWQDQVNQQSGPLV